MLPMVDDDKLRCSSAFFLDAMWVKELARRGVLCASTKCACSLCSHTIRFSNAIYARALFLQCSRIRYTATLPHNPPKAEAGNAATARLRRALPSNSVARIVDVTPTLGGHDGHLRAQLQSCAPSTQPGQRWEVTHQAFDDANARGVCIRGAGPGGGKHCLNAYVLPSSPSPSLLSRTLTRIHSFRPVCFPISHPTHTTTQTQRPTHRNSPGTPEMWPETATHECWGPCANPCLTHKDGTTLPSECKVFSHDLVFRKESVAGVADTYILWDTQRVADKMCITGALDAASGRTRAEMRACTGVASEQWRIDPVDGTISTHVHTLSGDERLCLTAPSTTVVSEVDTNKLRGECDSPHFQASTLRRD